jgi:hypothetical protein
MFITPRKDTALLKGRLLLIGMAVALVAIILKEVL